MTGFYVESGHPRWVLAPPEAPSRWCVVKTDIATGERVGTVADGLTEGGARQAAYALARADAKHTYQPVDEGTNASE